MERWSARERYPTGAGPACSRWGRTRHLPHVARPIRSNPCLPTSLRMACIEMNTRVLRSPVPGRAQTSSHSALAAVPARAGDDAHIRMIFVP
jgi:hypothetical protein